MTEEMSSPRSEPSSEVSVVSHWQDVLGVSSEVIQRLSCEEDFQIVVQNFNEYIATQTASVEEYEQTLRDLTAKIEEKNSSIGMLLSLCIAFIQEWHYLEQLTSTVEGKDATIGESVHLLVIDYTLTITFCRQRTEYV